MFAVGAEIVNKNREKVMKYAADTRLRFVALEGATGERILNIYALSVLPALFSSWWPIIPQRISCP
jgi:hypothetical protein